MTQELRDEISALTAEHIILMAQMKGSDRDIMIAYTADSKCCYLNDFLITSRLAIARAYGAAFQAAAVRRLMALPYRRAKWQGRRGGYAEKRGCA